MPFSFGLKTGPNAAPSYIGGESTTTTTTIDDNASIFSTSTRAFDTASIAGSEVGLLGVPGLKGPLPKDMPSCLETIEELQTKDPEEILQVPFLHTFQPRSLKSTFTRRKEQPCRSIYLRPMKRGYYAERYAKDPATAAFIGTGKQALDGPLVFCPGKQYTEEELDEMVKQVAFGRQHHASDFGDIYGAGYGTAASGGF